MLAGYLAYEFDKFWLEEEPESIMEFNRYREKFHDKVKGQLQMPEVTLIMTVDQEKWFQHHFTDQSKPQQLIFFIFSIDFMILVGNCAWNVICILIFKQPYIEYIAGCLATLTWSLSKWF